MPEPEGANAAAIACFDEPDLVDNRNGEVGLERMHDDGRVDGEDELDVLIIIDVAVVSESYAVVFKSR